MNNLPMLVTMRGSHVRRVVEIIGEICKLDGQIEEARVGLSRLDAQVLKNQLAEQDNKLIDALVVVEHAQQQGAVLLVHQPSTMNHQPPQ